MQAPKLQTLFLSLGSNLGNREENLNQAIQLIRQNISTNLSISNIYETEPWGNLNQAGFLNLILKIENSSLLPHEVLEKIQKIEIELGRVRVEKWGERCIDIDIIYFNDLVLDDTQLVIPHPFVQERKFVLVPLADVAPDWVHPVLQKTTLQMLQDCPDSGWIKVYEGF
ncbi:2-amino-4-hydroxy-6-hydroxymethyldihydropteridine diphosphokinase [Cellulophaga sp. BC115SP]|uniref:2-amino-4-hydroxy-6- hydroxymethyldihydropteridine diphosphokinase n=1 Tax=Cellulophaga sp. BC115SP TaxID=2683263 RepID=UPI0014135974|nr:2-amino-4-hydroxy-6-hydroxymethyldihydropteridine diphosphokinase [Cellulophaga sp. BC115SP]NBB29436.1 2-amino-4-hydroxy-6-hydroxymethyldihydropteridine diphosphokinase [Cellulophaga sp. BC115SP]